MSAWVWEGNDLYRLSAGTTLGAALATVRSDVIYTDTERLLVESSPGPMHFRARATTGDGRVFTVYQSGLTVGVLHASCDGRGYVLKRTSPWRKQREILGPTGVLATIRPLISGKVEIHAGPHIDELPDLDLVFLSWGCVLVDSPVRRPRV